MKKRKRKIIKKFNNNIFLCKFFTAFVKYRILYYYNKNKF